MPRKKKASPPSSNRIQGRLTKRSHRRLQSISKRSHEAHPLRYPLQMLPILLFELTWKAIYLLAFALPLWSAHRIDAATAEDIRSILMVVQLVPLEF